MRPGQILQLFGVAIVAAAAITAAFNGEWRLAAAFALCAVLLVLSHFEQRTTEQAIEVANRAIKQAERALALHKRRGGQQ